MTLSSAPQAKKHSGPWYTNLTTQVIVAMVLGILCGYCIYGMERPDETVALPAEAGFFQHVLLWLRLHVPSADGFKLLADAFIRLIKMIVAPMIFLTVVSGIAGVGDLKKVGRLGAKTILYFEILTTLALMLGIAMVYLLKPGLGVDTTHAAVDISKYTAAAAEEHHLSNFVMETLPENFLGAFTSGNLLQVLFVAVLFGIAVSRLGEAAHTATMRALDTLSTIFFHIVGIVMKFAPFGAFGAMAFAIGKFGLSALFPLVKLLLVSIFTMGIFIFVILGAVAVYYRFSLLALIKYLKDELLIVLGTGSSEAVLPNMMAKMQAAGCSKTVTGLVIPTGYSFNLDGSSIYLSMCVFFIAQAYGVEIGWEQGIGIFVFMMLSSKGAAAVSGSGFIVLAATIQATHILPMDGLALLLAIDRIMSSVRAMTNLVGNAVACCAIARMEGELDDSVGIITGPATGVA